MLKIASPFRTRDEVSALIDAGADELYCGYMPEAWAKRYTSLEFERKGVNSNFTDLGELRRAVKEAHKRNTPVFLTLNGLYVNAQYPLLHKILDSVEAIDFDAFIVADIGLLLTLRQRKTTKDLHLSTGGTVFNSPAVDFYKTFGVRRIVLDRQTSLRSMHEISRDAGDVEFEVFILNTLCPFIDGFCTFMHTYCVDSMADVRQGSGNEDERLHVVQMYNISSVGDACCLRYAIHARESGSRTVADPAVKPYFYKHVTDGIECGICALYYICRTDIAAVKIVGRQLDPSNRLTSTRLVRRCLDLLQERKEISAGEYMREAQALYRDSFAYQGRCKGNNCFHPDVICPGRNTRK